MSVDTEIVGRSRYLETHGWKWGFKEPRKKRKLFANEELQLLRPTVRREA